MGDRDQKTEKPTPRRLKKARQDLDRRALARSVGPEQAKDLAGTRFERQVENRGQRAVALRQALDGEHATLDTETGGSFPPCVAGPCLDILHMHAYIDVSIV